MKQTMRLEYWKRAFVVSVISGSLVGCQSQQLSWLGAESKARTPASKINQFVHDRSYVSKNSVQSLPATSQANQVAFAALTQRETPTKQSASSAVRSPDVIPVQYTQPVGDPIAVAVPREPFPNSTGPVFGPVIPGPGTAGIPMSDYSANGYGPAGPAGAICGPTVLPRRSYATHAFKYRPGQPYQPVYSQLDGCGSPMSGYGPCSGAESSCATSEHAFAVPRDADPQEYIFDGGDREPVVSIRRDNTQAGLDPEDTIVQYETIDGKLHAESGCRVAIYAPRFGSVRKRTNPIQADVATQVIDMAQPSGPHMSRSSLPPLVERAQTKPILDRNVKIVEAMRQGARPIPTESIVSPQILIDQQQALALISLFEPETLKANTKQALESAIQGALVWSTAEDVGVLVNGQDAMSIVANQETNGITHYERKGARVRLCKVASEQMAHPGDTITFTIRFDNVGETPVSNMVITDSLAPRLEYVPDSQRSTIEADFFSVPNNAGSEVLRWEFRKELPAGQGGLISFECKVR